MYATASVKHGLGSARILRGRPGSLAAKDPVGKNLEPDWTSSHSWGPVRFVVANLAKWLKPNAAAWE